MERSSHHNNSEPSNVIGTPNTDRTLPRPVPESATKTSERSAVVLALFGPSVGPCVGDFATTYNRVNGRLYAATRAILFYSNLFGFERRLCLQFSDIESIESYRSTSIRIAMVDCEDHIFRKFFNRDEVLRVLKDLYHQAGNSVTARVLPMGHFDMTPIRRTNQTEEDIDSMEDSQRGRLPSELSQSDTANESLESTLRPRSQSVPSLNRLITVQEKTKLDLSLRPRTFLKSLSTLSGGKVTPTNEPDRNPSEFNENDDSLSAFSVVVGPSAPPGFDMNKVWLEAKHPYSESALSITLSCSLEAFMDMFLSNDATFPIFRYQQESILDKNVLYSKWKKRSEIYPPSFDRDISFVHPLNNSVGPTQAKTNRQQSFKRFGTLGATLENVTIVNGVPGADCFRVEDRWSIESLSESSVQLTVTFQIVFSKRTMFKPIIQKNVKIETKKWFQGYAKFLRHALHEDDKKDGVPLLSLDSDMEPLVGMEQAHAVSGLHSPTVAIAVGLFLVFSVLLLQLFFLQKSVFVLQDELVLMRAEQQVLASMLNSMTNSKKC